MGIRRVTLQADTASLFTYLAQGGDRAVVGELLIGLLLDRSNVRERLQLGVYGVELLKEVTLPTDDQRCVETNARGDRCGKYRLPEKDRCRVHCPPEPVKINTAGVTTTYTVSTLSSAPNHKVYLP